jgi:hypothetical protein
MGHEAEGTERIDFAGRDAHYVMRSLPRVVKLFEECIARVTSSSDLTSQMTSSVEVDDRGLEQTDRFSPWR